MDLTRLPDLVPFLFSHISHHQFFFSPVALALREQVMAASQVPVGTNDVMLDIIVTPDETIAADGDASR